MMIGPRPEAVAEAEGKIKTADALVDFSQAHLDYHTIRSPIDGVLDSLTLPPRPDDRHRQLRSARWSIPGRSSRRSGCRPGRLRRCASGRPPASGPADARDPSPDASADEEKGMAGKVAFVGRVADPQTGNLPIRVLVDNPQGRLTIGQSVRVSIIVDERKGVLQVPADARSSTWARGRS